MKTGKLKMGMLMLGTLTMMTFAACNENVQGTVNEQGTVSQQEENLNAADHESVSSQEISEEVGQTDASEENPEELLQIAEISPEKKQVEIFFGNENGVFSRKKKILTFVLESGIMFRAGEKQDICISGSAGIGRQARLRI